MFQKVSKKSLNFVDVYKENVVVSIYFKFWGTELHEVFKELIFSLEALKLQARLPKNAYNPIFKKTTGML